MYKYYRCQKFRNRRESFDRSKRLKEAGAQLIIQRTARSCTGFRRWHGRKACPREPNRRRMRLRAFIAVTHIINLI